MNIKTIYHDLVKKLKRPLTRTRTAIFGYDIFISYSHQDSQDYAYAIAEYFTNKSYESYIDQLSSTTPGRKLPINIKEAVKRSTAFVLIGSENAQTSEAIEKEIQLFLENNKNKPVIPITIAGAINEHACWFDKIAGLAFIKDTAKNLEAGRPAQNVLDRIENALKFTKKSTRLRNISFAVLLGFFTILGSMLYFTCIARKEVDQAGHEKEKMVISMNKLLNQKKDSLGKIKDSLKKVVTDKALTKSELKILGQKLEILRTRLMKLGYLEDDPVKTYRLVNEAYRMVKIVSNGEFRDSSLSPKDYKSILNDYKIIDVKEPYILLLRTNVKEKKLRTTRHIKSTENQLKELVQIENK